MRSMAWWHRIEVSVVLLVLAAGPEGALAVEGPAGPSVQAPPGSLAAPVKNSGTPGVGPDALEPLVVGLVLNGSIVADAQMLYRDDITGAPSATARRFWLPLSGAEGWRVQTAGRAQRSIQGSPFIAMCTGDDRCIYDEDSAVLTMTLRSADLLPLRIGPAEPQASRVTDAQASGVYLNYDAALLLAGRPGLVTALDARVYTPSGHGQCVLDAVAARGRSGYTRLAGLWQVDRPQEGVSLQAGNITVPDTTFGAGLPVFGLRVGSNARLQPNAQRSLRPQVLALAGERALRTDVFVDGQFRQTAEVPYGPYSVEVAPSYPGRGQLDIVTTDASGLQQRVSLPYYLAPQLLKPGVRDWSVDTGLLVGRRGNVSRHGLRVVSASLRQGLDLGTTAQLAVLLAPRVQRVALATDTADATVGLTSFSAVLQRTPRNERTASWLGVGHEVLSRRGSFSVRGEHAMQRCNDVEPAGAMMALAPVVDRLQRPCWRFTASAGLELGARWSLSGALSAQRDAPGTRRVDGDGRGAVGFLGLRFQAAARQQLALNLQHVKVGGNRQRSMLLSWSQPFGPDTAAQVGAQHREGRSTTLQWAAQSVPLPQSLPGPAARRWQVQGSAGPGAEVSARLAERGPQAEWRVEGYADARGGRGAIGVAGAVGAVEGRVFTSRRIDDAFVLVDVGLPGLPVLLDNREVARTNAAGWAVVTEARAHQANVVGVDTSTLPIEYSMPRDQFSVVPASAAGALARFDLSDGGVAVSVTDEAGARLPAGAAVQVSTQSLPTAVTSRGEIFIDRSNREAEVRVTWPQNECRFRYLPASARPVYTCAAP